MSMRKKCLIGVGLMLMAVTLVSVAIAAEEETTPTPQRQRPAAGQRERGGGPRERGGFDRARMQERMVEMMKERLGGTDEEWTVIKPRLEKVMKLSQNGSGMMRGMGGRRGRRGRGGRDGQNQATEAPTEPVQIASAELQKTLDKEAPTTAEIKAKLAALRGAREKNKQELVIAQQKLKEVLSVKQEAVLVMMSMLE